MEKTFEEIAKDKVGTIYHQELNEWGGKYVILRGPCTLCAYVGIPHGHLLAGWEYDDIPVDVHGGLTYSSDRFPDKKEKDKRFWWYGWDYGHAGDMSFYDLDYPHYKLNEEKWTVKKVEDDSWVTLCDFERLMKLITKILTKVENEKEKRTTK